MQETIRTRSHAARSNVPALRRIHCVPNESTPASALTDPGHGPTELESNVRDRTCSVEGCTKAVQARDLCSSHYKRFKRHGDPTVRVRRPKGSAPADCSIAGCSSTSTAQGLCAKHRYRQRRHGDPLVRLRASNEPGAVCGVAACDAAILARGWCAKHYSRWRKHGDPVAPLSTSSRAGLCSVESCTQAIGRKRLCRAHYRRFLTYGDPLGEPSAHTYLASCDGCMTMFLASRLDDRIRWCSTRCRAVVSAREEKATRQGMRQTHRCRWCDGDIGAMRADAQFCSDPCSNRYSFHGMDRDAFEARRLARRAAAYKRLREYQRIFQQARRVAEARNGGGALPVTLRDWNRILLQYRDRCAYCGSDGQLQMDHVIPIARGGRHAIGNLAPACATCNQRKGARLIVEWRYGFRRGDRGPSQRSLSA